MSGNVYVFNVCSQTLVLSINGMQISAGQIPDWLSNAGNSKYRPNVVAVPRTLNASDGPGKFFNGRNGLMISWLDGAFAALITIDGSGLPLNQDLLLFINRTNWQLVNQFGIQVSSGAVTPLEWLRDVLAGTAP
ncbi:hypothetical protein [Bradyrhizobium sp. 2TAF24]|uniref:hypothetical protein n=1 Tax=Bradyrhizobium sp. 2TAF24 TaxID=3233011 RepID=UPI003F912965